MADDGFNATDYNYDVSDPDSAGSESSESWWWTEHLPELVWTGIWMFLFLVSLVANLMTIVTIFRHRELHTGYFVLHIFFSSVHIIYFLLSLFHRATFTLIQFKLLDSLIPGDSVISMMDIAGSVDDLNQCLLGLQILLLCTLTIDCCFTLSRKYSSKPKCQSVLRTVFGLVSFLTFGSAFSIMALLRFTDLLSSGHEIDDEIWPILIRCGLQIFLFICNPIFVIVIIGVVNCVTQRHSTRQLLLANDLARQLDFRHGVAASILLAVWMAERIITMAVEIEAYEDDRNLMDTLIYCRYGLGITVSFLASIFPLSAVCVLGRLCCCCSKKYSEKHEF